MKLSHFGGGGRPHGHGMRPPDGAHGGVRGERFLARLPSAAIEHFATQGDGNHFFYVGRVASTGQVALVTHHGSRKPGAMLYKAGMDGGGELSARLSPETPAHNAWIPAETDDGRDYWDALQTHPRLDQGEPLRDPRPGRAAPRRQGRGPLLERAQLRLPQERRPVLPRQGRDAGVGGLRGRRSGLTLIPLNMAEPILITRGRDAENGLGFAPHGAGRNFSRSAYMRQHAGKTEAQMVAEQTAGIDARFFCGNPRRVGAARRLQERGRRAPADRRVRARRGGGHHRARSARIMAGDWQRDAPWRKKKAGAK